MENGKSSSHDSRVIDEKKKKRKNSEIEKYSRINDPPISRFRPPKIIGGRRERKRKRWETYQESVGQFVSSGTAGEKTVTGGKERNWNVCGWCMRIYLNLTVKLNLFSVCVCNFLMNAEEVISLIPEFCLG